MLVSHLQSSQKLMAVGGLPQFHYDILLDLDRSDERRGARKARAIYIGAPKFVAEFFTIQDKMCV